MNWADASEVVVGLILDKRIALNSVRSELFMPPYSDIIKLLMKGNMDVEDIIERVGLSPVQAAIDASKNINGLGDRNWVKILENSATNYDAGGKLEKYGRKLQQGGEIDWGSISSIASKAMAGVGGDFVRLSDIEPGEIPFKETGFVPIDKHLGGIPEVGQVIVAAPPGTGKTTFMVALSGCYAKKYPEENVAIFTLEMMQREIALRFKEVMKLEDDVTSRIQINDAIVTPEEVISKAATIDHLGLVCVDFADLLIHGETTESTMAHIYRTFMLGAKQLGCPIILLSQLNRGYTGGVPRPNDIRYTGLAEALAWMILMLYNPGADWFGEEDSKNNDLTIIDGQAYIICWKVRGGFRNHKDESPGAISVGFDGKKGWNYNQEGRWHALKK